MLGAHVLDQLLRTTPAAIICLVRATSDAEARARVDESLRSRELATATDRVQCFAARLGQDRLGLAADVYADLSSRVTHIVHLAWPVNFATSLDSFEDHIAGVHQFGQLALNGAHRPTLLFGSSVASILGRPEAVVREVWPSDDPAVAVPIGYAQSKWVAEKVCERLAAVVTGRVVVARIGQLTGDTTRGIWNETEVRPTTDDIADSSGLAAACSQCTLHRLPARFARVAHLAAGRPVRAGHH